jgi:hypothetical protein
MESPEHSRVERPHPRQVATAVTEFTRIQAVRRVGQAHHDAVGPAHPTATTATWPAKLARTSPSVAFAKPISTSCFSHVTGAAHRFGEENQQAKSFCRNSRLRAVAVALIRRTGNIDATGITVTAGLSAGRKAPRLRAIAHARRLQPSPESLPIRLDARQPHPRTSSRLDSRTQYVRPAASATNCT